MQAKEHVVTVLEPEKKLLETQGKDARSKLDEAEQNPLKGGKKAMTNKYARLSGPARRAFRARS